MVPEKPLQFSLFQSLLLIVPQLELSSRSISCDIGKGWRGVVGGRAWVAGGCGAARQRELSSSFVAIPIVGGMVPERPALLAET